jgi:formate C-acetyltransferase
MTSACLTEKETRARDQLVYGPKGVRAAMLWFHNHGFGNAGATSGHLIPDYGRIIKEGWKAVHSELESAYASLSPTDQRGKKGGQLRAMRIASTMARDLAVEYSKECTRLALAEPDPVRKDELLQLADILRRVPWEPARTFWEGLQSLWLTHMLVMADENYPGPGVSFGRLDQYLYPLWEKSIREGMQPEFGKDILKCFWIHCNTAYDSMIRTGGNQGITAGYGQLFNSLISCWT